MLAARPSSPGTAIAVKARATVRILIGEGVGRALFPSKGIVNIYM